MFKRAKPAHKVRLYVPEDTVILTGHTRMTTQGDARYNYNNHPFTGKTADGSFALCHNGVLYNDSQLAKSEHLPKSKIETDSYVAAQLIEKYGRLDFKTIAKMSEAGKGRGAVSGNDACDKTAILRLCGGDKCKRIKAKVRIKLRCCAARTKTTLKNRKKCALKLNMICGIILTEQKVNTSGLLLDKQAIPHYRILQGNCMAECRCCFFGIRRVCGEDKENFE